MNPNAYPLQWPIGRARWDKPRGYSQFKMTKSAMIDHLYSELERMKCTDIIISTDQAPYSRSNVQPQDPGVAVYFKRKGRDLVISCDKYRKVEENIHAVGLAVEAFRTIERHGTGDMVDQAFTGFTALPEAIVTPPHREWYHVLETTPDATRQMIEERYKAKLFEVHPDHGGSAEAFNEVRQAYKEGLDQL